MNSPVPGSVRMLSVEKEVMGETNKKSNTQTTTPVLNFVKSMEATILVCRLPRWKPGSNVNSWIDSIEKCLKTIFER